MHLYPYTMTYQLGWVARNIQWRWVNREDRKLRVGFDAGSSLIGYLGWRACHTRLKEVEYYVGGGDGDRGEMGKLVQIVRKCNEYIKDK